MVTGCEQGDLFHFLGLLRRLGRLPYANMAKALSVVGYLAMVGGLVGLIFARNLFSLSAWVIAPQAAAVLLMIWARVTFGRRSFHAVANPTEGGLVTTGPYRLIRHPIYTAVCLFTVPAVLAHASIVSVLLGILIVVGALLRIVLEERMLVVRYPEYRQYAARTSRMIPLVF